MYTTSGREPGNNEGHIGTSRIRAIERERKEFLEQWDIDEGSHDEESYSEGESLPGGVPLGDPIRGDGDSGIAYGMVNGISSRMFGPERVDWQFFDNHLRHDEYSSDGEISRDILNGNFIDDVEQIVNRDQVNRLNMLSMDVNRDGFNNAFPQGIPREIDSDSLGKISHGEYENYEDSMVANYNEEDSCVLSLGDIALTETSLSNSGRRTYDDEDHYVLDSITEENDVALMSPIEHVSSNTSKCEISSKKSRYFICYQTTIIV